MQDMFLVCCFAFVKLLLNYSHLLEFSFCVKILMFQQVLKFKFFLKFIYSLPYSVQYLPGFCLS